MLSSLRLKQRTSSERPTSFRAYVDIGLLDGIPSLEGDKVTSEDTNPIKLNPTILPGEVEITHAENVLKYNTFSELKTGISGVLFCTNFKLSFVTAQQKPYSLHHQNFLLGENDICLVNIDSVYQVGNGRRRKLVPGCINTYPIETIEVHCKDFRVLTFSFKFSPPNTDKTFINSLLHHAFSPKLSLLFAFDYLNNASKETEKWELENCGPKFTKPTEWIGEMKRTGCWKGWRVTQANEGFLLCKSLPEAFVIPAVLLDTDLSKAAPSFMGHRVLTWSWGNANGQALIRMAVLDPSIEDNQQLIKLQEAVAQAHSKKLPPKIFDLDIECFTARDVQTSFLKLKELCMPATPHEFWEQDGTFYSSLETTRWFHCVSSCLKIAKEAAEELENGSCSVIIMEQEGKDLNCVISSLVQVLLDSFFRNQEGFESLIQKEWISLGHPFANRLGHIKDVDNEQAPVFLLFLDCIWQLTQQFPSAFEFSETYLTTLWDSTRISVFETFLFNNYQQRKDLLKDKSSPPSVWNWSRQYSQQDMILFRNPLYQLKSHRELASLSSSAISRPLSLGANASMQRTTEFIEKRAKKNDAILDFDPSIMSLAIWRQCYLRWVPLCNIVGGGTAVLYLNNLTVSEEIKFLSNTVKWLVNKKESSKAKLRHRRSASASDEYSIRVENDSRSFQPNTSLITSEFPFSPIGPTEWHNFNIPSNSYLCVSYGGVEETQDD